MTRLIAAAVFLVAAIAPTFACDRNKSAGTESRSNYASHNGKSAPKSHS
jgi:hypothetical protein